jgi:methylglutaconyl-CoA hydratase
MPENSDQTVTWQIDDRGVATVLLNRPERNNAYDGALVAGLHGALDALGGMDALRVVVVRGAGRHFQAGADLDWLTAVAHDSPEANLEVSRGTAEAVQRLATAPVPTVAVIQGACIGGGTGIAAACDVVLAADDAFFAISESRWGLIASVIFPQLCAAIGLRQARRYALTGERFDAHEARRIGLVHEVRPAAELDAAAAKLVDGILMNAPAATAATKRWLLAVGGGLIEETTAGELMAEHAGRRQGAEAAEGLASFREKRAPAWYPGA